MRIRTQLIAAAGAATVVAALVVLGLVHVTRQTGEIARAQADTHAVAREVTGLLALTLEYTLYGGERPTEQWRARHAQLTRTVAQAVARDREPDPTLLALQRAVEPLPALFDRLEEIDHAEGGSLGERRRQFLIERLMTEMQEVAEARYRWAVAIGEQQAREQRVFTVMVLGAPALLLAMIVGVGLLVGRRVLAPLTRLQAAADAVRSGRADAVAGSTTADELGDMARAFQAMTVAMREQKRAIEVANATLTEEVARRQISEQTLRKVTDNVPALMARVDAAQCFSFVNAAAARLFGGESVVLGRTLREVRGEAVWAQFAPNVQRAMTGEPVTFEFRDDHPERSGWYQTSLIPEFNAAGTPCGFFAITFDITERKRAEDKFRGLLEAAPDAMVIVDQSGRIALMNSQAERMFGYERAQMIGQPVELLVPERLPEVHARHRGGFAADPRARNMGSGLELNGRRSDGSEFPIEISLSPLATDEGTLVSGAIRDITERKQAEQRLAASEQRLKLVMDNVPAMISYIDGERRYRLVNRGYESWHDAPAEAILGRRVDEFYAAEQWHLYGEPMDRAFAGETVRFDLEILRNGAPRALHINYIPQLGRDGQVDGIYTLAHDVTDLRRTEQQLRITMDASPLGMFHADADGRCLYVNPAWLEIAGISFEQARGFGWSRSIHPDDRAMVAQQMRAAGSEHQASEHRYVRPDGTTLWVRGHGAALRAGGQLLGIVGTVEDITEQRRLDAALAERSAELARSNAELEQFAYVASHDLQEPLRMVSSYTQLLSRRHGDKLDGSAHEFMGFIEDGAKRALALIGDLLSLARVNSQGKPFEPVVLDDLLAEVRGGLRLLVEESGTTLTHDAVLPVLLADRRQLGQLLQNLIANALKFRGPEAPRVHVGAAREPDGRWRISVADNGIGIEPRFHERVFVMFQRLHLRGEYAGTGIGLAICKKVVERHGGRIGVDSAPGKGSTFWFTMAEAQFVPPPATGSARPRGRAAQAGADKRSRTASAEHADGGTGAA